MSADGLPPRPPQRRRALLRWLALLTIAAALLVSAHPSLRSSWSRRVLPWLQPSDRPATARPPAPQDAESPPPPDPAAATPPPVPEPEPATAADADLAREVCANLEELLDLRFARAVGVQQVTRDEALRLITEEIDAETPPERLRFMEGALIAFGLVPAGFRLRDEFLQLLGDQAQGFYIPRRKTLYLIRGMPLPSVVMAHELTHALQDQCSDLQALTDARRENDDALAALQAVYEGEAVLSMGTYMTTYTPRQEVIRGVVQAGLMQDAQAEQFKTVPLYLQQRLLFPYVSGRDFMLRALRADGWQGTRGIYQDLPESSEQILHPDKYFRERDRPTVIDLAGLAEALGPAWQLDGADTLGEIGTRLLIQTLLGEMLPAVQAADGWDGDRFALLRPRTDRPGAPGLIWLSTWDSQAHAHRFCTTYARALTRHLGTEPSADEPAKYVWTRLEKPGILLRRWGQEVLLLQGFGVADQDRLRICLSERKRSGRLFAADQRADGAPGNRFASE